MAIQINHDHQEKIEFLKISAKFLVTVMYMIPRLSFFYHQSICEAISIHDHGYRSTTVVNQRCQSLKLGY